MTPSHRQHVVDALCEAYAADRLGMQELERRLDRANRARTGDELAALLNDLGITNQDLSSKAVAASDNPGIAPRSRAGATESPREQGGGLARIDASQVPERQLTVAFWSARSRKGTWVPARRISAIALQGGIELDFREALLGPGVTEVHAVAFMGAVEIVVPPELHIETSGLAVMGAFEDEAGPSGPPDPDAPVLRLTGFALMGAVDVQVRLPGESPRQARQRRRRERRESAS